MRGYFVYHGFRKLPINKQWDSLSIGTMQGMLLALGYYHDEPCGVFGPGTLQSLKKFLLNKGYFPRNHQITTS